MFVVKDIKQAKLSRVNSLKEHLVFMQKEVKEYNQSITETKDKIEALETEILNESQTALNL